MSSTRGQLQKVQLPGPGEIVVSLASRIAKSPKAISLISLWIFGIYVMLYASAPYPTSEEQRMEFAHLKQEANSIPGYDDALHGLQMASEDVHHAQHWFWSWNTQSAEKVHRLQAIQAEAAATFNKLEHEREELMRSAFNTVGLWSEYGVEEARSLFWSCLEQGKGFAKRSTFYDMIFGMVMGRDENIGAFIMRVILNFVINVTLALFGTIVAFGYYLWSMVVLYKAGFASGLAFFAVALLAGVSMAMVYISVIYGTVAVGGYTLVYSALNNQRLEGGGARQQQQRIDHRSYQQRPHHD